MKKLRLPRSEWKLVWRRSAVIMALSTVGSYIISNLVMMSLGQGMNDVGMVLALGMPTVLGGPILLYLQIQSAQLREANRRLEALASTDWLTDCLNRRAFTSRVGASLRHAGDSGALLVIDADHFKTINDRFGHERGDEVLQLIAGAIRDNVQADDLVGRLGGEEFAVYLSAAGSESLGQAAERIRKAVNALIVTSEGVAQQLSVSIGGAISGSGLGFAELFRIADRRLYEAKHAGRNRCELGETSPAAYDGAAAG